MSKLSARKWFTHRAGTSLVVSLFLFLAGCGGGGGGNSDNDNGSTRYTIGGSVSGLSGTLVLRNNGGDDLTIENNSDFTFATSLANGAAYSVTVKSRPAGQACALTGSTGSVSGSNVSNMTVTCTSSRYVTNGTVYAVAVGPDGTTYIGGSFTQIGPVTGSGVPLDASTGVIASAFPEVTGDIDAVVPDGSNGWYIGGSFTHVGGTARNNIAHILADGTLDSSWSPDPNGTVKDLAMSGGTLYVGGSFTSIGGQTRNRLAAFDTSGITAWNPNANGTVEALEISESTVYSAGSFTNVGGKPEIALQRSQPPEPEAPRPGIPI